MNAFLTQQLIRSVVVQPGLTGDAQRARRGALHGGRDRRALPRVRGAGALRAAKRRRARVLRVRARRQRLISYVGLRNEVGEQQRMHGK